MIDRREQRRAHLMAALARLTIAERRALREREGAAHAEPPEERASPRASGATGEAGAPGPREDKPSVNDSEVR